MTRPNPAKRGVTRPIPVYQLYGEREHWPTPDLVHSELIAERSRLHDWEIKVHQHHGLFQLLYLKGGAARVVLDASDYVMKPGQLVFVPPMCVHGFRFDPDAHGHVVTLAHPLADMLFNRMGATESHLMVPRILNFAGSDRVSIDAAFSLLDTEYRGSALHRDTLLTAVLQSLFVWISRQIAEVKIDASQAEDRGGEYFKEFARLIEQHYAEGWPVSRYARKIGITPAHLNTVCRKITGYTALALLHQRIVLAAKRELVYTTMTINVVSETLGFADPAYFTRFFRRNVGVSPKEFRSQASTMMEVT